jgi:hypothetical protein
MSTKLVTTAELESERVDLPDDRPPLTSWWWVKKAGHDESDLDKPGKWLACVVEVGSNYVKVEGVRFHLRIGIDDFYDRCQAEPDPHKFIDSQISKHRDRVRGLMSQIKDLCHRLGVPMRQALAEQETASTALAVAHSVDDVKQYKNELVKAKEKTLPELFRQVKKQHEEMAVWMKAELIPAEAELKSATEVTSVIQEKIHTVELYAGLQEELVQVREGEPADLSAKVHLMQRMHYMDEECLAKYEAGGMDFEDVEAFDEWIGRDGNFGRILPHDRCIVAFRIRRKDKDYGDLNAFIRIRFDQANRKTFLYIRNGRQLWRMSTSISFGTSLFPRREDEDLLGDQELWVMSDGYDLDRTMGVITSRLRDGMIDTYKSRRAYKAQKLWQWHRAGKPNGKWMYTAVGGEGDYKRKAGDQYLEVGCPDGPISWHFDSCYADKYEPLTPSNIYYDDVMARIREAALEHNRIAVIVQGLLDRSTCLHPHPPWRIWTSEGFAAGVELVYDVSLALTPGEALDFEKYREQLNKSLKVGCHTIGQTGVWNVHMKNLNGDKSWRHEGRHGKGPDWIHQISRMKRDGSCEFRWMRHRSKAKWVNSPNRPGYLKAVYPEIEVKWLCAKEHLTCVDAYTPGDFHLFYDDPRTRADYLKWAYILLSCEDWHARKLDGNKDEDEDTDE